MNTKLLKAWTHELRTTDKTQGEAYLHRLPDETHPEETFCCLGILCEVAGMKSYLIDINVKEDLQATVVGYGSPANLALPPREVAASLGVHLWTLDADIRDRNGYPISDLPSLNDHIGLTFSQIADMIDCFGLVQDDD